MKITIVTTNTLQSHLSLKFQNRYKGNAHAIQCPFLQGRFTPSNHPQQPQVDQNHRTGITWPCAPLVAMVKPTNRKGTQ